MTDRLTDEQLKESRRWEGNPAVHEAIDEALARGRERDEAREAIETLTVEAEWTGPGLGHLVAWKHLAILREGERDAARDALRKIIKSKQGGARIAETGRLIDEAEEVLGDE